MIFKVYAGSIFCGVLLVGEIVGHMFRGVTGARIVVTPDTQLDQFGRIVYKQAGIERITGYKRLQLKRVA